ncbi:hypothetical protein XELAEV_18026420mg [Xenopus laevis]|uniref:Uncharacterized protein n=1 Tax=Xenopus laevis TaxID=8355 RepID=A0A974CUC1_XENLA|nr:hypothetical protein XELAEV_18026420mg [Xenopus laevis]
MLLLLDFYLYPATCGKGHLCCPDAFHNETVPVREVHAADLQLPACVTLHIPHGFAANLSPTLVSLCPPAFSLHFQSHWAPG